MSRSPSLLGVAPVSGPQSSGPFAPAGAEAEPAALARASRSSFLLAFTLLPKPRRAALSAVYAFCRAVDDAGDDAATAAEARAGLAFWSAELDAIERGRACTPIGRAVVEAVSEFGVETHHLRELIAGVAMDVEPKRYATLGELDAYCRKVASAVGLACLPVFGARSAAAQAYAEMLGLALQLTNILRDVRDDAIHGRVYLPVDRLVAHGVELPWLRGDAEPSVYARGGAVDALVRELIDVARARFARAAELLPESERRALLPAQVMGEVYQALLDRVARRGGRLDVARRVRVPRVVKLGILARALLRAKFTRAG